MTQRRRAKILLNIVIAILIVGLGILFVAASIMAHIYDAPPVNDDAGLSFVVPGSAS